MEPKDKKIIQFKYAASLNKMIAANRSKAEYNKLIGKKDLSLISSLRKLEAASGISFPIIQSISKGKKNPALTTIIALAEGLNMTAADFFTVFDSLSEAEIRSAMNSNKKKQK